MTRASDKSALIVDEQRFRPVPSSSQPSGLVAVGELSALVSAVVGSAPPRAWCDLFGGLFAAQLRWWPV
jgi:hypothetical protein